ncbi:MAG: precorrin-3B C(17)-methyltransferase [Rhodospirillales bacterium]|nr:MAG: precorrin-3B C(17)-methyltransferase [Rhodospirillales bacterium]
MSIAIVVLDRGGLALARRIQPTLAGATVHGLTGRADGADISFSETATHLRLLFAAGHPILGICAAGILIRALAPLLADKRSEPPVVALAEDGSAVVPLLGGHRGANALARRIAEAVGGFAAVTTAGDVGLGIALDEPPEGWIVVNPERAKIVTAALLAGEPVRLVVEAGDGSWPAAAVFAPDGAVTLRVTDRAPPDEETTLIVHPPVLALGVGCERGAEPAELDELVSATLAESGLAPGAVATIGSLDLKSDEPAIERLAAALDRPARFFPAAELEAQTPRLANPSEIVFREVGCHGVAEGAALAMAGPAAELIVPKRKSARATCAIARSPEPIDARAVGRARGTLSVVGIGPGANGWRTAEATQALTAADEFVGYELYLDLVDGLLAGKPRHDSALGEEEARVRTALDLAAEGRSVALVCSGDPGIYALATLVFELLDREHRPDWNRVAISVVPGLSALQAAAARAGAPLGHDFCAISLSDLLTPRATILKHLRAAAEADFVVALYNPQSRTRRELLGEAKRIMLSARPSKTPVIVARNLGRSGEEVDHVALCDFDVDSVDMLTLVIIGSSATRSFGRGTAMRTYTPRGYAKTTSGPDRCEE